MKQEDQQEQEGDESVGEQENHDDSNMADSLRLTAPDVHREFTVRRLEMSLS